ncbi:hypothetical protein CU097_014120 [Rhizopus azygosporus]|uniref:CS domain-containing protein n=1 Tax=Rhizopus azygosporus TaxID=86630 RepID=A0A367KBQ4_RHIAZ|nr:hypothetical protein CU097_014120 [Rhizopus azygosporus]
MLIKSSNCSPHYDYTHKDDIPSTIIWTQTLESITFKIESNQSRVHFSEYCLNLHNPYKSISLPLFDKLCLEKCAIDKINNTITFLKESFYLWPRLLSQQTDQEIGDQLLEANFLVCIHHDEASFDTLDFDSVINGQGQKTGLE